jgi:ssDNA-binding Zn-finger/Zn-ribbon topoisomerase 1
MGNTCPNCGTSMEFEEHEVRLRTGTCPSCTKEFAFVEGATVSSRLRAPPSGPEGRPEATSAAGEAVEGGPECDECGSPLSFRAGKAGGIEAVCPECETTTVFVPQRSAPRFERAPERFERAPRFESSETEGPRSRPCRKCGAPLRFSTGDDGMLVGECESCGNRFTLPPREERGGGGGRGGPRFGRREYRPGPGSRPPFRGRGGRPFRGSDRRGPPRSDDDDNRRKRRRREE